MDNNNLLQEFNTKIEHLSKELGSSKESRHQINILFEVPIKPSIMGVDFRSNLINLLRTEYESRAFHLFYIESIDFTNISSKELPMIQLVCDRYILPIPLSLTLYCFKKNDVFNGKLFLDFEHSSNTMNIYVKNKYISCKIKLNNNQIIVSNPDNSSSIKDQTYNKIYRRGDETSVKITDFTSNQLQNNFTPNINCIGIIV